jgi:glucose dehydrogenase
MRAFRMVTVVALAGLFSVTAAAMDLAHTVAGSNDSGEWRYFGGSKHLDRYSPLSQTINYQRSVLSLGDVDQCLTSHGGIFRKVWR